MLWALKSHFPEKGIDLSSDQVGLDDSDHNYFSSVELIFDLTIALLTLKNGLSGSGTSQLNFKERGRFETLTVQLVHLFHIQVVFETPLQSRQNCAHLRLEGENTL